MSGAGSNIEIPHLNAIIKAKALVQKQVKLTKS